jgi:hypothetical protein
METSTHRAGRLSRSISGSNNALTCKIFRALGNGREQRAFVGRGRRAGYAMQQGVQRNIVGRQIFQRQIDAIALRILATSRRMLVSWKAMPVSSASFSARGSE